MEGGLLMVKELTLTIDSCYALLKDGCPSWKEGD